MVRWPALVGITETGDEGVLLHPLRAVCSRVRLRSTYHDWVNRSSTDLTHGRNQVYGAI